MADPATGAARYLVERLGRPRLGVVLGSGFSPLLDAIEVRECVSAGEVPGYPRMGTDGHRGVLAAARRSGGVVWIFGGRLHLYEQRSAAEVVLPVRVLAAAGAAGLLLTCACGGLGADDRPGDFVLVRDHLNLTGVDPVRALTPPGGPPAFVDLQQAYDEAWHRGWREAARRHSVGLRGGVLAAMPGPSYETPAEVQMLQALGADAVSMSTVPEVIAARYLGMRVCALGCVANRGAGMGRGDAPIRHVEVLDTVGDAVRRCAGFLVEGVDAMLAAGRSDDPVTAAG